MSKTRIRLDGEFDRRYKKHEIFTPYQKYGFYGLMTLSLIGILFFNEGVVIEKTFNTPDLEPIISIEEPKAYAKESERWEGIASYYNRAGCLGCHPQLIMANGEPLDDLRLTIAFNRLPLNSHVIVTNKATGNSVQALVTDTGGFEELGRIADLGEAVKNAIECTDLCEVSITRD